MNDKQKAARRRILLRTALILEVIVCYMAVLTVVSYARGPERYQAVTDQPLLKPGSLTSFTGVSGEVVLPVENMVPGQAVGWQGELDLATLKRLYVSFQIDCPAEYAGGKLFVDLYNNDAGYDSPEQEYTLTLAPGVNEVECRLNPGGSRPDKAFLRMFTLDMAGYDIENLQVCREEPLPKVSTALWAGMGVCFLLLAGTAAAWWIMKLKSGRKNK